MKSQLLELDWVPVPCECGWLYNGWTGLTVGKTINNFIQLTQLSTFSPGRESLDVCCDRNIPCTVLVTVVQTMAYTGVLCILYVYSWRYIIGVAS